MIDLDSHRRSEYCNSDQPIYGKASYSIYRRKNRHRRPVLDCQNFRLEDPTAPIPNGSMVLYVSDCFPSGAKHDLLCPETEPTISISHEELNKMLLECERHVRSWPVDDRLRSLGRVSLSYVSVDKKTGVLTPLTARVKMEDILTDLI